MYFADPGNKKKYINSEKTFKRQHMTFMMMSSNDDKSDICQFFYQDLFHIVNIVYVQKLM